MPALRRFGQTDFPPVFVSLLAVISLFLMEPFSAVQAETALSVSASVPDYSRSHTVESPCDPTLDIPMSITPYVAYANLCVFSDQEDITALSGDEIQMFNRLNEIREANGLPRLMWHPGAARAARMHGVDMMKRDYFAHASLEGLRASDRLRRLNRREVFGVVAENLAWFRDVYPQTYSGLTLQRQLEQSPKHYQSMVDGSYTHVGLSIVRQGDTYIAVQVFLSSEGQLEAPVPSMVHSGDGFELPPRLGLREVGGWRLVDETGAIVAKGYDRSVRIPEIQHKRLRLMILAAETPTSYLILNGPSADYQ